jgi:hypothetical protein
VTQFVSIEQAKARIRLDDFDSSGSADDLDLQLMIRGASAEILRYIRSGEPNFLDSSGEPETDTAGIDIAPEDVQDATLLYTAIKWRNRDEDGSVEQEHGFMPKSVLSILYGYRLPTMG